MGSTATSLRRTVLALAFAIPWLAASLLAARPAWAAVSRAAQLFPIPAEIRPAVAFWIDVFARYTSDQTIIHDNERLDIVYGVLDFSELARSSLSDQQRRSTRANAEELEKERIRNLLRDIARHADRPGRLTAEQRRIYELFAGEGGRVPAAHFLDAVDRVRAQTGQKDRFIAGLRIASRYLPEIEEVFAQEGVPVELTRLPFVESMFNLHARSSAGASGVWQFIRSTGRRYLRIDHLVDERNDPILAARAAARLLADNHAALKTWPLAITAYNHGKYGMLRAVAEVGSRDIGRIVREYRGPAFGFASRNFYAEFLAALHVERNATRYFGSIEREAPYHYDLVAMPGRVTVSDLARRAKVDLATIRALNPGLTERALRGREPLPRGYAIRVPADRRARLVAAKFRVRPGWRPRTAVAAARAPVVEPPALKAAAVGSTATPLAVARAEPAPRVEPPTPPAPRLDPEIYRAQIMAAEEEALALFLASAGDAAQPADGEATAGTLAARPPEASGDRLLDAAVEAAEANATVAVAGSGDDGLVHPGPRVQPTVSSAEQPIFHTVVRGGETVWRLAAWSEEPIDAFRARNGLEPGQVLPVGRRVSISSARVDPETFEARRRAYHEELRARAERTFKIVGTRPHRIEPGETPWRLAETNGVPFWLLEQVNEGRDLSAVRTGDTLLVPIVRTE
ncbi:MAG TPA: lytic transglycosylase domain-containing protein [Thermodesulfobacteriota bacterium]